MDNEQLDQRKLALDAILSDQFIADFLRGKENVSLAREIASGTVRRELALDHIIQSASKKRVRLKPREKALLRLSIYQLVFMDNIPAYAVIDEALKLADEHSRPYIHAILSNLKTDLPQGLSAKAMSTRLSYPLWFTKRLISTYGNNKAEAILKTQNKHVPLMARRVGKVPFEWTTPDQENVYIQNITPATLLQNACKDLNPTSILDLCASPGGKIIAAHDLFPEAKLYANDLKASSRLQENFTRFNIDATITQGPGEAYQGGPFDLVIVDVPCSNSGVLYKRPEARWRLSKPNVQALIKTQRKLLQHARTLGKHICYMTCSILPEENEEQTKWLGGECLYQELILPNEEGWEGGYVSLLHQFPH